MPVFNIVILARIREEEVEWSPQFSMSNYANAGGYLSGLFLVRLFLGFSASSNYADWLKLESKLNQKKLNSRLQARCLLN